MDVTLSPGLGALNGPQGTATWEREEGGTCRETWGARPTAWQPPQEAGW